MTVEKFSEGSARIFVLCWLQVTRNLRTMGSTAINGRKQHIDNGNFPVSVKKGELSLRMNRGVAIFNRRANGRAKNGNTFVFDCRVPCLKNFSRMLNLGTRHWPLSHNVLESYCMVIFALRGNLLGNVSTTQAILPSFFVYGWVKLFKKWQKCVRFFGG